MGQDRIDVKYLKSATELCLAKELRDWYGECVNVFEVIDPMHNAVLYEFHFQNWPRSNVFNVVYLPVMSILRPDPHVKILTDLRKIVEEKFLSGLPLMDQKVRRIVWKKERIG